MRILIGDDSEFMRTMLKNIVLGVWPEANIDEAETGQAVIDHYGQNPPDVMLLDIMMPEKTGLEALKELGPGTPAIIISAADQENMIQEATALGAKAFIVKPFDPQKVIQTIQEVVGAAQTNK